MSTGDISSERRVPVDDDWRDRIEHKLDALITALLGTLQNPGGALQRLDNLDQRVSRLEAAPAWVKQTVASVVASVLTAIATAAAIAVVFGGKH